MIGVGLILTIGMAWAEVEYGSGFVWIRGVETIHLPTSRSIPEIPRGGLHGSGLRKGG